MFNPNATIFAEDPANIRLRLSAPRYSKQPFPPYRFTPGRHPHPIADPRGHSYEGPGHRPAPVAYRRPDQWRQIDDYLYGCDLYNHGYWWEAHEAWEGYWRATPAGTAERSFLQGLIQVSACHLKLFLASQADAMMSNHLEGVSRLRGTSVEHLHAARKINPGSQLMGMVIDTWISTVNDYYLHAMAFDPPSHVAERFPYALPE